MPSAPEITETRRRASRFSSWFELWNRKLHYYVGLYLLFFLWLFALSGLLLNHGGWKFAEFWPQRKESRFERAIHAPSGATDLERARNLMAQLGIRGEVEWTRKEQALGHLDFRVGRPGRSDDIEADLQAGRAAVHETAINGWGVFHVLHTFTGVRSTDSRNSRDWLLTSVWSFSMDALSAGLLFMVLSGCYIWLRAARRLWAGAAALVLGLAAGGWLVTGLAWISR